MRKRLAIWIALISILSISFSPQSWFIHQNIVKAENCTWKEIASQSFHPIANIVFDKNENSIIYGTDKYEGLLRSKDYGKTWTAIKTPLPSNIKVLHIITTVGKVFIATDMGVFKSTSQGENWIKIFSPYTSAFGTDRSNTNIMFAGTDTGKIYRSLNGGASWSIVANFGSRVNDISVSGPNGKFVIVATNNSLYKSEDEGVSWNKIYSKRVYRCKFSPTQPDVIVMTAIDSSGSSLKVLISQDMGSSWNQPATLKSFRVYDFSFDYQNNNTIYLATEKHGIVKAENLGMIAVPLSNGMPYLWTNAVSVNPDFPEVIFAVGVEFNPTAIYHLYYLSCPIQSADNLTAYFDSDAIRLSWVYTGAENPERFEVYYRPKGVSYFTKLKTVGGEKRSCSEDQKRFVPDIEYEFVLKACTGLDCSAPVSDTAMKLKKPRLLHAILYSNTEKTATIRISWDTTSIDKNAEYINVYRNDPDCTGWFCFPILVKTIKRNDSEFTKGFTSIPDLKPDKRYILFISANEKKNGKGTDFSYSDSKEVFVPGIPSNFEAYSKGKFVYFKWKYDNDAQNRIDKFVIYARNSTLPDIEVSKYKRTAKSVAISKPGNYLFVVSAVKGDAKTISKTDNAYILRIPEKPAVSFAEKGVKIKWDKNAIDKNANKIQIVRKLENSLYLTIATVDKNEGEYNDKMIQPGNTYSYGICAVRTEENKHSDISDYSQFTKIEFVPPAAPSTLSADATSCKGVNLTWKDNSNNEAFFIIERKESGGSFKEIAKIEKNKTRFVDNTVVEEKTYVYRVKAVNGAGSSQYSNEVTVSIPMCKTVPNPPDNLTASLSKSGVILKWQDNSDNEEGFAVERKEKNGNFTVIGKTGRNETEFEDNSVIEGKTYIYRITAFNDKGSSDYSNEVEITIPHSKTVIVLQPDNPIMFVNGKKQEIDPGRGTKPVIIPKWGRTVVPIRAIVEALGGTIEWDGVARKVTIKFNGNIIELWIDNPEARVNGKGKWIDENNHDVRPIIVNDRTMLPLRFVVENLGCRVEWEPKTRKITIIYIP